MNIARKLLLISIALSVTAPAQAQSPKQGDYYVANHMVLHRHRIAALVTCTDGIKFASDSYITCMLREGENP
jgi:hypothetical protein